MRVIRFLPIAVLLILGSWQVTAKPTRVYEVGDIVPDMCWKDADGASLCHAQFVGNVRVLIYGTGWCPGCNTEMAALVPRVPEFDGRPVTFFSLSAQGDTHGSLPTPEFLREWRRRHRIPFAVLASPRDAGKAFFPPPVYIPNVVVIGHDGSLRYKAIEPKVDDLFAEIRKALGDEPKP